MKYSETALGERTVAANPIQSWALHRIIVDNYFKLVRLKFERMLMKYGIFWRKNFCCR